MSRVDALSSAHITTVATVVVLVLVVIGVAMSFLITAVIGRVIVLVVVVALAIAVWQQRGHVRDNVNKQACDLQATFFGIHVDAPADVRNKCGTTP